MQPLPDVGPVARLRSTRVPAEGHHEGVNARRLKGACGLYAPPGYSNTAAAPIPVPMHMDTTPYALKGGRGEKPQRGTVRKPLVVEEALDSRLGGRKRRRNRTCGLGAGAR